MRVLVTGGCGYIGSATARWLRAHGADVHVIDDLSEGHREAWDGPCELLDLLDRDRLHDWLAGRAFDGVIHFAARCYVGESVHQPVRYWRANLVPVIQLTEALEGVPFVFSSTCATYGNPLSETLAEDHPQRPVNPYGATKLAAERLLRDRSDAGQGPFAALRYFNAAGADQSGDFGEYHDPETHLIPLAVRAALGDGGPLSVFGTDWDTPDGTCVRDYIHIDDLAAAHLLALERLVSGGEAGAWNLGTGRGLSVREVIDTVASVCGSPVPFTEAPRRAGDPARLVADASRARVELGWEPRYTEPAELIETAVRWHRSHPRGYSSD
jgi:UDP-glucose-4-epimerase GalE